MQPPQATAGPAWPLVAALGGKPNTEMNLIGWGVFFGLLVVLLPLAPFVAVVWLLAKFQDAVSNRD
jgi:hypothetical protein